MEGHSVSKWFSVKNLCIVLAVISFGIYANTLWNGYVLDDGLVLSDNSIVMKGIKGIPEILGAPRSEGVAIGNAGDFYRPLPMVMYALEVQLFGASPAIGHLVNIFVFIGCVLMLFVFLDKLMGGTRTQVAFIAAFLFAVHPVHTEVVANIKSRDELLCYFFAFWSLCLWMNYKKDGRAGQLATGIITLFLAYLSKETVIVFVVVVPLLFFFYGNENRRRAVFIIGGMALATLLFLGIRYVVLGKYQTNEVAIGFIENALVGAPGTGARIATALLVLGKYLKLLFVPYPLLCNYSFNSIPFAGFGDWAVLVSVGVYGFLALFSIYRLVKNKKDLWAFAVLFYLVALALFSNCVFLVGAEMAERFVFFASTGFCMVAALVIDKWVIRQGSVDSLKSPKVLVVLILLLIGFGGMAIARNRDWKSNYTLYRADLSKSPNDSRLYYWLAADIAQNQYGAEPDAARQKELDGQSIGYLKKAIEIYPGFDDALAELGWIYEREHDNDSALFYDRLALRFNAGNCNANNNMGSLYYSMGKYNEAIDVLNKVVAGNPRFKTAYMTLANCYLQTKQYGQAIANGKKVLELDPVNADAHQALGNVYLRTQDFVSAEDHFNDVIKVKPNYMMAINNLGVVYLNTKRFPQAAEQFKKAISLNPGYINAYSNLGRAYFFMKQYDAAINIIFKELEMEPNTTTGMPILALCYQKIGNMELASKYEAIAKQTYPQFKLQ